MNGSNRIRLLKRQATDYAVQAEALATKAVGYIRVSTEEQAANGHGKYTFAELSKPFEMRYSTVKRDSGLLNSYSRERAAIEALHTAFKDLKDREILSSYERRDLTGPRKKLLDVVFKIWPSTAFVREVKAANKRQMVAQRKR